jgi:nucleoside-diphosphate-sugar epimerase
VRVFVTGGTGLVGRHVIAALRARGDTVRALARTEVAAAALSQLGAEPVRGDLSDAARLDEGIAGSDAVVHAAAIVLAGGRWPAWHAANVLGTERVALSAARHRARLVHISSVAVYGRRLAFDGGPPALDEEFDLERAAVPRDYYARSKREAELAVWQVAREAGLSAVALRPCVIYGEGDRHFSPRVARVLRRWRAPLIGDGANLLTVVYAGNVAAAVTAALDRGGVNGPFNVTNDGGVTQREFVERFAAGLGVPPRWIRIPYGLAWRTARAWDATIGALPPSSGAPTLSSAVQFLAGENTYSSARAQRLLDWRPPVPAGDAVERTAASFRGAAPPCSRP